MSYSQALTQTEPPRCLVGREIVRLESLEASEAQALRTLLETRGCSEVARIMATESGHPVDRSQVWKHQRGVCSCVPGAGR